MDKAADLQKHTKLPCEKDENCCLCIPLKLGMQIFAVLSILGGVLNAINAVLILTVSLVAGIIVLAFSAIGIYIAFVWYQWLKKNDQESTQRVVRMCKFLFMIDILLNIVFGVLFIIFG